jgi:hypothetical protein
VAGTKGHSGEHGDGGGTTAQRWWCSMLAHQLEQGASFLGCRVEEGKEGSSSVTRGQRSADNDPIAAGVGGWCPGVPHGFKTSVGEPLMGGPPL